MATIDIYCVDDSKYDTVMWIDSALTYGDIGIKDVKDMVSKVINLCNNGDRIGELRIFGHGNAYGQYIGADWLDSKSLSAYRPELLRLQSLFVHPDGLLTLGGCQVGLNGGLLADLSMIIGVPVRAWTALQRPLIPGDEGSQTKCYITCMRGSKSNLWDWVDN